MSWIQLTLQIVVATLSQLTGVHSLLVFLLLLLQLLLEVVLLLRPSLCLVSCQHL